ncbi:MAG: CvpA family protein [Treponema sp.]|nr:CvpA family protein [Treponema sp.]
MQFVVIDIVCFGLILIFAIRAMLKGFVEELFSIGAMALGIAAGFFFYKNGAVFIREQSPDLAGVKVVPEVMSFIALFILVFLVMKFIEKIISDIMERIHLSGIDKFLGFLLGILEGLCVTALVFFVLYIQPLFDPLPITTGSLFAAFFKPFLNV